MMLECLHVVTNLSEINTNSAADDAQVIPHDTETQTLPVTVTHPENHVITHSESHVAPPTSHVVTYQQPRPSKPCTKQQWSYYLSTQTQYTKLSVCTTVT